MAKVEAKASQLVRTSAKRTREIFTADFSSPAALEHTSNSTFTIAPSATSPQDLAQRIKIATKIQNEYEHVRELPPALAAKMATAATTAAERRKKIKSQNTQEQASNPRMRKIIEGVEEKVERAKSSQQSTALALRAGGKGAAPNANGPTLEKTGSALVRKDVVRQPRPEWKRPWRIAKVISGHMGWVRR